MSRSNPLINFLSHNKYWIVLILGVLITGFLDENSFMKRIKLDVQKSELKEQIEKYNAVYEKDQALLKAMRKDRNAVMRIAREHFFMKNEDEDIFVLSDEIPGNSYERAK